MSLHRKVKPFRQFIVEDVKGVPQKTPGEHSITFQEWKGKYKYNTSVNFYSQIFLRQRLKLIYAPNLSNRQFLEIIRRAKSRFHLQKLLSHRLDFLVVSLRLATSFNSARQLIRNGVISVNGKPVRTPSYYVHLGDVIECPKYFLKQYVKSQTLFLQPLTIFRAVHWNPKLMAFILLRTPPINLTDADYQILRIAKKIV